MPALNKVKANIVAALHKYNREPGSVKLLAVSKRHSVEKIRALIEEGQLIFGENYLQEALEKMAALSQYNLEWHFIGHIQANKTHKIAEHFNWVQSVENEHIAQRLNDHRPSSLPPLNICIEVNICGEAAKSGVAPESLTALAQFCHDLPNIHLRGLMTIPAIETQFEQQRAQFKTLFSLWQDLRQQGMALDTLSMGMSDDFEAAIAEGSTMIRLGTALFGPRDPA